MTSPSSSAVRPQPYLATDQHNTSNNNRNKSSYFTSPSNNNNNNNISQQQNYDTKSESPSQRNLFGAGGEALNANRAAYQYTGSVSQSPANSSSNHQHSLSPFRAPGPHYSPDSLVEPPTQAGPSGLWVNRVAR